MVNVNPWDMQVLKPLVYNCTLTQGEIRTAVKNGVVKMNIDTDTQWAYWDGLRGFYVKNEGYLQGQVS